VSSDKTAEPPTPTSFPKSVPVVIVGAGPTGVTAATLLAQYGVQCVVLERWNTSTHSRVQYTLTTKSAASWRESVSTTNSPPFRARPWAFGCLTQR
jgi:thioredoxin reductase